MIHLGGVMLILDLHHQGLSVSAIARQTGMDRKTVRKAIQRGLVIPAYSPRLARATVLDGYLDFVQERMTRLPGLSVSRLFREMKALGYSGGYSTLKNQVRRIRPRTRSGYEHRFETPSGQQAQVDFAYFKVLFTDAPETSHVVWLFSMVLAHSRYLWACFVAHQDLQSVIRCHVAAFAHFKGVPREILYDQMKTAVLSSGGEGPIVYNASLVALASHYGFRPKACQPYRAQTKGKVERPFRTIRQDFFLGRTFRNLADLNAQLAQWLMEVANARVHGTTNRMVLKAFAQEQSTLQPLPAGAYQATLKLERRISHDGMVSVEGNLYSVPDSTRRRVVEVHILPNEIHILEENRLVATHPVLEGHRQRSLLSGHRQAYTKTLRIRAEPDPAGFLQDSGGQVVRRSLAFYAAIAQYLAKGERT